MDFEWDPRKDAQNQTKHGVSFDEASSVFGDRLAMTGLDDKHSHNELREITIGLSHRGRLLVVTHTERHERTRIINARQATPRERRFFEENAGHGNGRPG